MVEEYDDAITFFTRAPGFELVEDSSARANDRPVGLPPRLVAGFGEPARDLDELDVGVLG